MTKFQKFEIKRFKKDGTEIIPVKVRNGLWVEPHSQEEYDKNIEANKLKEKKDRFIYFPGTKIPHIHYMEIRKFDTYGYLGGGPMPWTDPSTIIINKELLNTENLYDKLEKAKKDKNKEQIRILTRPLVTWFCPQHLVKKNLYAQSVTISNRNDKSDFVYENLYRFENAIKEFEKLYLTERISTKQGISSLINLLSSKMAFRVGNEKKVDKHFGVGVTTFKPQHISFDEKNRIHFKFNGKKNVSWHKKFEPKTEVEKAIFTDLMTLKHNDTEYLFMFKNERITSGDVNDLFGKVFEVKENEKDYLSFHSWRHFLASKNFLRLIKDLNLDKEFKNIEDKKDINMNVKKARLLAKEVNAIFKEVAPVLNDTPGVVKNTYSGGKIFKKLYDKFGVEFDEKKRSWKKDSYTSELEAEKARREQRKLDKLNKGRNNV